MLSCTNNASTFFHRFGEIRRASRVANSQHFRMAWIAMLYELFLLAAKLQNTTTTTTKSKNVT